jgi:hypothetical protein
LLSWPIFSCAGKTAGDRLPDPLGFYPLAPVQLCRTPYAREGLRYRLTLARVMKVLLSCPTVLPEARCLRRVARCARLCCGDRTNIRPWPGPIGILNPSEINFSKITCALSCENRSKCDPCLTCKSVDLESSKCLQNGHQGSTIMDVVPRSCVHIVLKSEVKMWSRSQSTRH